MYISIKRHSWFFKSWWCLLYFGYVQTRTIGKCWRQKTPFCFKLSTHAQWRQKTPFCLKLSTHVQKSVLSWSISMSRILGSVCLKLIHGWSHQIYLQCKMLAAACWTCQFITSKLSGQSKGHRLSLESSCVGCTVFLPTSSPHKLHNTWTWISRFFICRMWKINK